MKSFSRRWPIHLLAAIGLSIWLLIFSLDDAAEVYTVSRLIYVPLLAVPVFLGLAWLANRFFWPAWAELNKHKQASILGVTATFLAMGLWLFPPLQPDFATPHHLLLSATGENAAKSTGTAVLVRQLNYLDGRPVESSAVSLSTDWQVTDRGYLSNGAPSSRLEIQTEMPVGIQIILHYGPEAGILRLEWDGQTREINLYAVEPANLPLVLRSKGILTLPSGQAFAAILISIFYAFGMVLPILAGVTVFFKVLGEPAPQIMQWASIGSIALLFIVFKGLYLTIDDPHIMGDSFSYVATAEHPLNSLRFWLGQRPFTIPLFVKMFGFTTNDYYQTYQLIRWEKFQTVFSACSWAVLAFTLAWTTQKRWLRVLFFGMVLSFSLSMEISLWDALLLSESLSFSFLALMVACWLGLVFYLPRLRSPWLRWGLVVLSILVTIFFAFGRDSNIYSVLVSAVVLAVGSFLDPRLKRHKAPVMVYAALVLAIFAGQYFSLSQGNRWQVFLYDHLGMRILLDPEATTFFADRGLPLSESLMQITAMGGSQYQKLINESAELKPVKDWVACCGKSTYIQYLLSDPLRTLVQPYENWKPLINGSLRGYRNPHNGVVPMPGKLLQISNFFFRLPVWGIAILILACVFGLVLYLRHRDNSVWLVVAALLLPILPMMGFIWWAEPMEIDRHAAQIIIQLRLGAFIALALITEFMVEKWRMRHFSTIN